jgi:hypothetical protein
VAAQPLNRRTGRAVGQPSCAFQRGV